MARNRIAFLKARAAARKDPLRRAVGAPAKRVAPNLCPLGQCEHAGLLHQRFAQKGGPPLLACTRDGCECKEAP